MEGFLRRMRRLKRAQQMKGVGGEGGDVGRRVPQSKQMRNEAVQKVVWKIKSHLRLLPHSSQVLRILIHMSRLTRCRLHQTRVFKNSVFTMALKPFSLDPSALSINGQSSRM
jgi:hypothetical protein